MLEYKGFKVVAKNASGGPTADHSYYVHAVLEDTAGAPVISFSASSDAQLKEQIDSWLADQAKLPKKAAVVVQAVGGSQVGGQS